MSFDNLDRIKLRQKECRRMEVEYGSFVLQEQK